MKKLMFVTALAVILSCAGIASADQLAVNGTGLDPTQVGTTGFTLSETSNGATTMTDIVFLFSVPTGFGAPSGLSSSAGTFGSASLAGTLTNTGCNDVYTCVASRAARTRIILRIFRDSNRRLTELRQLRLIYIK